jgi:hypothetical protein
LKRLHGDLGVPYRYLEWRAALSQLDLMHDNEAVGQVSMPEPKRRAGQPLSLPQLPF